MAFNNFPYADLNITNLDFLFDQQKDLHDWVIDRLTNFSEEFVDKAYIDAKYDVETETLTLFTNPQKVNNNG